MTYQSLARKYRPRQFADMVGQDGVTKALGNAIQLGRSPHGVIFSGVRGIGKTTTARLYAKALNCVNGPTAEPCDQCESCLAINDARHEDVLEIDGASHTGVDDIRALQETLDYVPQRSSYKVYIIDEVHMLSQSAFNALLKTLEEPPPHVVFIFATTELNKVPETILSRCQTFHLKRLSIVSIMERLKTILEAESIAYEAHALALVAKEGRGSMRDALTFLDQVVAVGNGQVQMAALDKLLAFSSSKPFLAMLDALINRQAQPCLEMIASWDLQGVELAEVLEELIKFVRHSFIVRDLGTDSVELLMTGLDPDEITQLAGIAKKSSDFDCNRLFRTLVQCRKDLEGSNLDRFIFENYVMEWCLDPGLPDLKQLGSILTGQRQPPPIGAAHAQVPPEQRSAGMERKQDSAQPARKSELSLKERFQKSTQQAGKSLDQAPKAPMESSHTPKPTQTRNSEPKPETNKPSPAPMNNPEPPAQVIAGPLPGTETSVATRSSEAGTDRWPASWRELVDEWKKQKPLQARILEEVHPITYSPELIHMKIDRKSYAAARLTQSETQNRLRGHFQQLFDFNGELRVSLIEANEDSPVQAPSPSPLPSEPVQSTAPLPETILEVKQREKRDQRDKLKAELQTHPITREVLSAFDGTISRIEFEDGSIEAPGGDYGIHESRNP